MKVLLLWAPALLLHFVSAAERDDGYFGYRLEQRGDPESAVYETSSTDPGLVLPEEPDVYLNASVSVGHIGVEVDNITAKINLDAQVLKLLKFNAGVDASIDRVKLTIENVSAKVELEARLGNVVAMVDDVLSSIDLNPIIATLGQEVTQIVNDTLGGGGGGGGGLSSSSSSSSSFPTATSSPTSKTKRSHTANSHTDSYTLDHNILYSVNDYAGQTHTNRVLAQTGDIYDEYLDNDGAEVGKRRVVGYYARDMVFTGHNRTVYFEEDAEAGQPKRVKEFELQYLYAPFPGLEVTSWVYVDATGEVLRTRVIAEASGGGTSTVSKDEDE
ncbi:hypothetical protein N657DRAFT_656347 [Parathielavia appendiculata]|uniref:Uncharacterized protein n=1 Tax=Parathielavia appendiculata TaxID=2587402 RepID=A0AAN6U094_9PEZI|nr:hypothetical protein N657DRAFT_656347 [Parathielavia appendiculata]